MFQGNKITATEVTELRHYTCARRYLDLSGNSIGDDEARRIADTIKHSFLQELYLDGCDIGVDGAEALPDAEPSDMMVEFDFSNSDIGLLINKIPIHVTFEPSTTEHPDSLGTPVLNPHGTRN